MKKLILSLWVLILAAGVADAETAWLKLTDISKLSANSEIVITSVPENGSGYAMGNASKKNNRPGVAATFSVDGSELTLTDDMMVLKVGTLASGKYTLLTTNYRGTSDGYLVAGTSSNYCTVGTKDETGWDITIDASGEAVVKYAAESGRNLMRCNDTDKSNILFSCYAQGQKPILIYIKSDKVVDPDAVSAPAILFDETTNSVTMTCATAGAEIHYTLDGTAPTAASTLYSNPFVIAKTTTIKAVAVKNGKLSPVNTYEAVVPETLTGFGQLTDDDANQEVMFNCDMTAVWQSADKRNLYVRDAEGKYMLIFGNQSKVYSNGDTFRTLKGTYSPYNGLPEIKDAEIGETTPGTAVNPEVGSAAVIADANLNAYYVFDNVEVSAFTKQNATMTLADGSKVTLRDNFKLFTTDFTAGSNYKVTGFVAKFNTTMQFYPISIEESEAPAELGELKVTLSDGTTVAHNGTYSIKVGDSITASAANAENISIVSQAAGANVSETGDHASWSATKEVSGARFEVTATLGDVTKKMSFTLTVDKKSDEPETDKLISTTFDFTDPANFGIEAPAAGAGTDLCAAGESVTFTSKDIEIVFAADENATNLPRLWNSQGNYDVRLYANTTLTFKGVNSKIKIYTITFTQNAKSTKWGANNTYKPDTFDYDTKVWNGSGDTRAAAEGYEEFVMTPASSTVFATAKVEYKIGTGITDVTAEAEAPVVYYNLQGMRVENPAKGQIVIRVQGCNRSKVIF